LLSWSADSFADTVPEPESYSGFDSAPYRNVNAKWHFPQPGPRRQVFVAGVEENATSHDLQMAARESKPL
jgi:hypothetical protein